MPNKSYVVPLKPVTIRLHCTAIAEVFPNFTIIFHEEKEGAAPFGNGVSLDSWLGKMDDQMQRDLATELIHVFKEATAEGK